MKSIIFAFSICLSAPSLALNTDITLCWSQDEEVVKACVKSHWHSKLDSIRLTESVKRLGYDSVVAPLAGLFSFYPTSGAWWPYRVLASVATRKVAGFWIESAAYAPSEFVESQFRPRETIDLLHSRVDQIVDDVFSGKVSGVEQLAPLSRLESVPLYSAAMAFFSQDRAGLKERIKTYWRAKLETIRLTNSIKEIVYRNDVSSIWISSFVYLLSLKATEGYGLKARIAASLAIARILWTGFSLSVDGIASFGLSEQMEARFHSAKIVDCLQAEMLKIVETSFAA